MATGFLGGALVTKDPYKAYRDEGARPLSIKATKLKHYTQEEALLRAKLELDISHRERVILSGLHWILVLADKDDNFDFLFPDFMLLMQVLSHSPQRVHQQEVVRSIMKTSFARAKDRLADLFATSEDGRFDFIRLFHMLRDFPQFHDHYIQFYHQHFAASLQKPYAVPTLTMTQAIKDNNYQALFAYLVQTSFLHHYRARPFMHKVVLPPNTFPEVMREFEAFNYKDHPTHSPLFRQLGYLVTHVVLALTNYGRFAIEDSINKHKAKIYIEESFDKVRDLGDFDLLAEYVQCLKIINPHGDERIQEFEQFIFRLQRPDGSWGTARDFATNPYTAIHPTGAALMELNQGDG